MVGNLPTSIRHHCIGQACRLIVARALFGAICLAVIAASPRAASPADGPTVNFGANAVGAPPQDFEFGITGHGQPGQWVTVNDESAIGGEAVE